MLSNLHRRPVRVVCPTPRCVPPFFRPSSFMGLTMRAKCPFFSRLVLPCPSLPALRRVLKAPSAVGRPILPLLHVPFHSRTVLLLSPSNIPYFLPLFQQSFFLSSSLILRANLFLNPHFISGEREAVAQGFRRKSILLCLETF